MHLDRADADEGQGDEEEAVLGGAVGQHVRADRVHEGDAEGLDAGRAPAVLARRHLVDDAVVETARRRADGGRLRRGRRQRVELPAGA